MIHTADLLYRARPNSHPVVVHVVTEKKYIYDVVVRSKTEADMIANYPLMLQKSGSFQLEGVEGEWIEQSYSGAERALTHMTISRTLTGSSQFFD